MRHGEDERVEDLADKGEARQQHAHCECRAVALATLEKKIVRKYNIFLKPTLFLVLEGYDPRIHALYYCPQLYRYDENKEQDVVPLEGPEIGKWLHKRSRTESWRSSRGTRPRKCCRANRYWMEI
jgi:hypothetical protein